MMTKKEFVQYINEIRDTVDYTRSINNIIFKYNGEGFLFPPDCSYVCTKLLSELFNDENDIEYFCWELDFGRLWKPGSITDENGNEIVMENAEKLYDYLITRKN